MSRDVGPGQALNIDKILLRPLCNTDLEAVLKIERRVQINPWSRLSLEQSLTQPHICTVVEYEGHILAFYIVCLVADELHILNLAVAADQQGKGLGHVLLDDIVRRAAGGQAEKIFLEVRESNQVAQGLYQKWQFRQIAIRKNYYGTGFGSDYGTRGNSPESSSKTARENALVMVRDLNIPH